MKFSDSVLLFEEMSRIIPSDLLKGEDEIIGAVKLFLTMYPDVFAENLKMLRTKKGINQIPFAKKLGVAQTTYSSWETGSHVPRLSKILLISELLEIDVGELFSRNYMDSLVLGTLPVFSKSDFFEIKLDNFFKDNLQHHQIRISDNFSKKYQFVFRNTDDEMIEQGYGIPKNSNVYCMYDHCFKSGLLSCIQKVDGKVVLMRIAGGPVILREIKYDGTYIRIKAWKTEIEDKVCLFDENQPMPKGNENSAMFLNNPLVVSMIEILGIACKVMVDLN
ncbi:MAG: helix-turn-helix domain-containing protein [Succinivibrio sp.]